MIRFLQLFLCRGRPISYSDSELVQEVRRRQIMGFSHYSKETLKIIKEEGLCPRCFNEIEKRNKM